MSNLREDDTTPGSTDYDGEKYFIFLCWVEKRARAQMKFNSQVVQGEGVKEGMDSSLYTLNPCLTLLVAYLMGKGNVSKPALVVCDRGMQEGVHRVSSDVVSFAKWVISKCKLGVKFIRDLEFGSMGKTIHCPIVDHTIW